MHATFLSSAAAVLTLATSVNAAGQAIIKNQCSDNVYLWSVSNTAGDMVTINNGGTYRESYRTNPDGGGISIKIATQKDLSGAITQFEYTLGSDFLWYDVSNINGYPFMKSGLTAIPSESTCSSIQCPAGVAECAAAYNVPTDNFATAACAPDADMVVVLCSSQQGTSGNAGASSVAASIISSAKPADFTPISLLAAVKPAAAPAVTSAARFLGMEDVAAVENPVANGKHDNLVVFTTLVIKYVTVEERDAAPTAIPAPIERRHQHHPHHQAKHHA